MKDDLYAKRGSLPSNFLRAIPEAEYAIKAVMAFKDEYMLEMVNLENIGEKEQDWNEKVIETQIVANIKQFILKFGNDFVLLAASIDLLLQEKRCLPILFSLIGS